jgi:hypothetical protein
MKTYFSLIIILSFFTTSFTHEQQIISLKIFAEEAMSKSLIGNNPIIVANPFSAKIYSKLDLNHPVWNNLKREELIIIPKNSDLVENLWGEQAKLNGVIVYKAANEAKPDMKMLRYVLNGKEISHTIVDTINMKNIDNFIVIKNRKNQDCVAFITSVK